jgi:hypothetical protein
MQQIDPIYLITALLGIVGSLSACLVWVVKKVFDVVENNTQVNDRVGNNLETMTEMLKIHDMNTKQTFKNTADISKNQKAILELLTKKANV